MYSLPTPGGGDGEGPAAAAVAMHDCAFDGDGGDVGADDGYGLLVAVAAVVWLCELWGDVMAVVVVLVVAVVVGRDDDGDDDELGPNCYAPVSVHSHPTALHRLGRPIGQRLSVE